MKTASFILVLLLTPLGAPAAKLECRQAFVQTELRATQSWLQFYAENYPSRFSMNFERATAFTFNTPPHLQDVISFGSGPDIYTPLASFPGARNIHLVDLLAGWGKGTGHVFF